MSWLFSSKRDSEFEDDLPPFIAPSSSNQPNSSECMAHIRSILDRSATILSKVSLARQGGTNNVHSTVPSHVSDVLQSILEQAPPIPALIRGEGSASGMALHQKSVRMTYAVLAFADASLKMYLESGQFGGSSDGNQEFEKKLIPTQEKDSQFYPECAVLKAGPEYLDMSGYNPPYDHERVIDKLLVVAQSLKDQSEDKKDQSDEKPVQSSPSDPRLQDLAEWQTGFREGRYDVQNWFNRR